MNDRIDYYAMLDVAPSSPDDFVRDAYRQRAMCCHPEFVLDDPDAQLCFILLAQAYVILSDPVLRRQYDAGTPVQSGILCTADALGIFKAAGVSELARMLRDIPH